MSADTAWKLLRDAMFGNPADKQRERIKAAIKAIADCKGEIAANNVIEKYHRDQVIALDPYSDWWTFAYHRQEMEDCIDKATKLLDALESFYSHFNKVQDYASTPADAIAAAAATSSYARSVQSQGNGRNGLQSVPRTSIVDELRAKPSASAGDSTIC